LLRRLGAVLFSLLLVMFSSTSAIAATSQGLEWGYEEGKRYDFIESWVSKGKDGTSTWEDGYYLLGPEYTEISDPLNVSMPIPARKAKTYWLNGSDMMTVPLQFAVPVGNWSLLTLATVTYAADFNGTLDIVETAGTWGYVLEEFEESYGIVEFTRRGWQFSKSDGVLERLTYYWDAGWSPPRNVTFTIERIVATFDPLIAAVVIGIPVMFVIVVTMLRLHRR
jgi:hypothetical protein